MGLKMPSTSWSCEHQNESYARLYLKVYWNEYQNRSTFDLIWTLSGEYTEMSIGMDLRSILSELYPESVLKWVSEWVSVWPYLNFIQKVCWNEYQNGSLFDLIWTLFRLMLKWVPKWISVWSYLDFIQTYAEMSIRMDLCLILSELYSDFLKRLCRRRVSEWILYLDCIWTVSGSELNLLSWSSLNCLSIRIRSSSWMSVRIKSLSRPSLHRI